MDNPASVSALATSVQEKYDQLNIFMRNSGDVNDTWESCEHGWEASYVSLLLMPPDL
jgi:hypothetical protein